MADRGKKRSDAPNWRDKGHAGGRPFKGKGKGPKGHPKQAARAPSGGEADAPVVAPDQVSQAQANKPMQKPLHEVVRAALHGYVPRVPRLDAARVEKVTGFKVLPVDVGPEGSPSHGALGVCRSMATLWALGTLVTNGHRVIDSRYGNVRDDGLIRYLNQVLASNGYGTTTEPFVTLRVSDGWLVPADTHRRTEVADGELPATAAIYVDVYLHGVSPTGTPVEVTPQVISDQGYDEVIWIGHPFLDLFGTVDTALWIRKGNAITWFADEVTAPYPPHPACDLMYVDGGNGVHAWSAGFKQWYINSESEKPKKTLVYRATRFVRSKMIVKAQFDVYTSQSVHTLPIPDIDFLLRKAEKIGCGAATILTWTRALWQDHVGWLCPSKTVVLSKAHVTAVRAFLATRRRNEWSYGAMEREVNSLLSKDEAFLRLETHFYREFMHYRRDLAMAAWTMTAISDAWSYEALRATHAATFEAHNTAKAGIAAPMAANPNSWNWKWKLGIACAVVAFIVLKRKCYQSPMAALVGLKPAPHVSNETAIRARAHSYLDKAINAGSRLASKILGYKEAAQVAVDTVNQSFGPAFIESFKENVKHIDQRVVRLQPLMAAYVVLGAPVLEELAKRVFPGDQWKLFSSAVIAAGDMGPLVNTALNGPLEMGSFLGVRTLMHYGASKLPLKWGWLLHTCYNIWAVTLNAAMVPASGHQLVVRGGVLAASALRTLHMIQHERGPKPFVTKHPVEEFDDYYHSGPAQPVVVYDESKAITSLHHRWHVPASTVGDRVDPKFDPNIKLSGPINFPTEEELSFIEGRAYVKEEPGYWRAIGHNYPMYKPAKTGPNMTALIKHRLIKDIPHRADPETWVKIYDLWWSSAYYWSVHGGAPKLGYALLDSEKMHVKLPGAVNAYSPPRQMNKEGLRYFIYEETSLHGEYCFDFDDRQPHQDSYVPIFPVADTAAKWNWFLEHLEPGKRKRAISAKMQNDTDPLTPNSPLVKGIQLNQKCDEVLLKPTWVSRPIDAVHPRVAVRLGMVIYPATQRIKQYFQCRHLFDLQFKYCRRTVTLGLFMTYGAGLTASELSDWFMRTLDRKGIHIIVAGDDSAVIINFGKGRFIILEGDISQNDHSVRMPALSFEWRVLKDAGVDRESIELLEVNARAPRVISTKKADFGLVTVYREAERNTGGVDTTVGNSLGVLAAWTHTFVGIALVGSLDVETLHSVATAGFATCGYDLKCKVTGGPGTTLGQSLWPPSFLKGTWYLCKGREGCVGGAWLHERGTSWVWAPLLSRYLKVLKTMSYPPRAYRFAGEHPLPLMEEALRRHMVAVGKSMLTFATPDKIRVWLKGLVDSHPRAAEVRPLREDIQESWRPRGGQSAVDLIHPEVQIAAWYGVREEEVVDFIDHLTSLKVGDFSQHPMWAVMALRDYA